MRRTLSFKKRATYLGYRGLGEIFSVLPGGASLAVARGASTGLNLLPSGSRRTYARHLRRVLGDQLSPAEIHAWTRRAFESYARFWIEGARLSRLSGEEIEARMTVESGFEFLEQGMEQGNGVILALPHVGCWDWGGAWLARIGYPMTTVAERIEPPELFEWFVEQRRAVGIEVLPLGEASAGLMSVLRSGGMVGLLCDRNIGGGGIEVEFFGEKTSLPTGPALLALRSGASLIPAAVYAEPNWGHRAVVLEPIDTSRGPNLRDDLHRVTQEIARALEGLIARSPEQWHLFQPNWPSDPNWSGDVASWAPERQSTPRGAGSSR